MSILKLGSGRRQMTRSKLQSSTARDGDAKASPQQSAVVDEGECGAESWQAKCGQRPGLQACDPTLAGGGSPWEQQQPKQGPMRSVWPQQQARKNGGQFSPFWGLERRDRPDIQAHMSGTRHHTIRPLRLCNGGIGD